MKTLRKVGHKDVVTHPLSHSDSKTASLPFGLHQTIVTAVHRRNTVQTVALSHICLRTFCDSHTPWSVTRERRSIATAAQETLKIFRSEEPDTLHAFIVSGVQFFDKGPITPPMLATFRQYSAAMGMRTRALDLFPAAGSYLLLIPVYVASELPMAVWDGLAARLFLEASPSSVVKGDTPLP